MEDMFDEVRKVAEEYYGGHFTIFSFTNGFKGCFGTPNDGDLRDLLTELLEYKSLDELLGDMASSPSEFDYFLICA